MAYKRERVITGFDPNGRPCCTFIGGKTQDERQINTILAFAKSGRLWDVLPANYLMDRLSGGVVLQQTAKEKPSHPLNVVAQEWSEKHLELKVKAKKLSNGLRTSYLSYLKNHVLSYFGDKPIEDIRHCDVQEFINTRVDPRTEEFYAEGTINLISSVLNQVLDYAVTQDIIPENPMHKAPILNPSEKKSTRTPLSKEDLIFIRSRIPMLKTEQERLFMILLSHLPYRKCEALGQRWEDIDFENKICRVTGDVVIENGQAVYHKGRAKNQFSLRPMCASDAMMEALKPYKKDIGFVLSSNGTHLSRREIDAVWYSIKKQIPLLEEKGISPYCFRHTMATIMYYVMPFVKSVFQILERKNTYCEHR